MGAIGESSRASWWTTIFQKTEEAQEKEELACHVKTWIRDLGFNWFSYGIHLQSIAGGSVIELLDGYPPEWSEHYLDNDYLLADPIVRRGLSSSTAIVWHEELFQHAAKMRREATALVGIVQPSWSRGVFGWLSLSRDSDDIGCSELDFLSPRLRWIADNLHRRMHTLLGYVGEDGAATLSERETEILRWTADGKTAWEVGKILGISTSTVNFHVNNILGKLGASNKLQAVSKAAALGWLGLPYQPCTVIRTVVPT